MDKWGIKQRVLGLALIPTILISVILGIFFTNVRLNDLVNSLEIRGQAIAHRLAPLSEYDIFAENSESLHEIARNALNETDVDRVAFYNKNGIEIASAGKRSADFVPPIDFEKPDGSNIVSIIKSKDRLSFIVPITQKRYLIEDFPKNDEDNESSLNDSQILLGWLTVDLDRRSTILSEYKVLFNSGFFVLFGLLISGLLALRMGQNVTKPILEITRTVEEIKQGKLSTRIKAEAKWELGILKDGINTMADSLEKAHYELQNNIEQATADLRHTLETIEIQNVELELSRKEAENANKAKSEFLANMSHELRTPLNGLIGFIKLMQKTTLTPQQQEFASTIQKSASTLLSIINDILDISRIEAGKLRLDPIPMDIRDCVEESISILAPSAHEKAIELVPFTYSDVPSRIIADPLRIKQLITNLVSNSIKFTETGSVIIRVMLEDRNVNDVTICISVTDTGIGLSPSEQKELFHAFNQINTSTTKNFGGTGLGLVICKNLVEQMNGKIELESSTGKGSTFRFTIKVQTAQDNPLENADLFKLKGARILLYEAHPTAKLVISNMLSTWGARVDEALNPEDIEAIVRKEYQTTDPYELVLVSINQPSLDSTFFQDLINNVKKPYMCMFGALINTTDYQIHNAILQLNADLCLAKPLARSNFNNVLRKIFSKEKVAINSEEVATNKNNYKMQILAVDDNPENLKLICAFLDDMGIAVTSASSGTDAIKLTKKYRYDLILMDILMPVMDGIETTKIIRKIRSKNTKTPIVAVTAHAQVGEREALFVAGMDDCLTKPINEYELRATIYKWTQKAIGALPYTPPINKDVKSRSDNLSIDWNLGKKLAGGKEDLAKEMMTMLINSLPNDKEQIIESFNKNDYVELREKVHKLHGACCYCGVPKLKSIAAKLERAVISKDEELISSELNTLTNEIDNILKLAANTDFAVA